MQKMRYLCLILLFPAIMQGQDIHFSQFNRSYLNLNPALCGSFNGDYRLNGNFRNQWSSISEPYRTISFAADAKALIRTVPNLNFGLVIFNDKAGIGDLQNSNFLLNVAYIQPLNSDSSISIKGGLQGGLSSRSINYDAFSFDNQFRSGQFNDQLSSGENFGNNSINRLALNTGLSLEYFIENRKKVEFGMAFFNLNQADQSFEGELEPLDIRSTFFLQAEYEIHEEWDLLPALLFSQQGEYQEMVVGSHARYRMSENEYYRRNLYFGLWLRPNDAIIPALGLDYNQWHFGASYDINVSSLEVASNQRGGLELSVTYILSNYKVFSRKYQQCPKFL